MHYLKYLSVAIAALCYCHSANAGPLIRRDVLTGGVQDVVTYDKHSLIIRGERQFIYSGSFQPFRLPVPGLWLDIFQKIKALGFNGADFYVDWALIEGQPGRVNFDGIFDLKLFFDGAAEAGLYLIARPGPYINAEVAAGGMPGWTLRIPCRLRSNCTEYEDATRNYMATVGKMIADAQITNGGPVILVQPENEYTTWPNVTDFPDQMNREYMAFVEQELRDAGIVVPLMNNDNEVKGYWAPGTGLGSVDLYGIDAYPLSASCDDPDYWPYGRWPVDWQITHEQQSPDTPFLIPEFEGGSGTSWQGATQDKCTAVIGPAAQRILYKNNYSFGVKLMNIYTIFGGTNWGNLGKQGGDSSYDGGSCISEFRELTREKYSEQKLQANFFKVSPAYLTATPGNATNGTYASTAEVSTTPLHGQDGTNFYVVRHAVWNSTSNLVYKLTLDTSVGRVIIPQLGGGLSLLGRDAKLMVTDYDLGGSKLVYSTADIMTWAKSETGKVVVVMYGTEGEIQEFAVPASAGAPQFTSKFIKTRRVGSAWAVQWSVTPTQQLVSFSQSQMEFRLLWRNDAYNYWVVELPKPAPIGNYSSPSKSFVIVKAGYLVRSASIDGKTLSLNGDFNATTDVEVAFEPTDKVDTLVVNGARIQTTRSASGRAVGTITYKPVDLHLPDFTKITWNSIDSLPEIQGDYDDSLWTLCDHRNSTNDNMELRTPTSLYASDYGYHHGSLLYRGHFTANGKESNVYMNVSGGWGFGYSVYLNSTFLGSWLGNNIDQGHALELNFPKSLAHGAHYVLTIIQDHMGQDEEAPGTDAIKFPKGILTYQLSGHAEEDVTWKMTGNLYGENYIDKARGPKNEGGMFAERQGFHLPGALLILAAGQPTITPSPMAFPSLASHSIQPISI